ncbi:hypothetical protein FB451DRAFT_1191620 [Mycena latifolia]|nr:hypothetical protein FB451DRAFT_1191620 [Mycena latifolia]
MTFQSPQRPATKDSGNGAHLNQTARDTTALWVAAANGHEAIVHIRKKHLENIAMAANTKHNSDIPFDAGMRSIPPVPLGRVAEKRGADTANDGDGNRARKTCDVKRVVIALVDYLSPVVPRSRRKDLTMTRGLTRGRNGLDSIRDTESGFAAKNLIAAAQHRSGGLQNGLDGLRSWHTE